MPRLIVFLLLLLSYHLPAQQLLRQSANQLAARLDKAIPDADRIEICLKLAEFHINKPAELEKDLDSAFRYLNHVISIAATTNNQPALHRAQILRLVAEVEKGNRDAVTTQMPTLAASFEKQNDFNAAGELKFRVGYFLYATGSQYGQSLQLFHEALQHYQQAGNQEKALRTLQEIAYVHMNEGQIGRAEIELKEVLNGYKKIGQQALHPVYTLLSSLHRMKGEYNKALDYSLLCIENMNSTGDTSAAANNYGDLARIYSELGDHEKSIEWHKRAFANWRSQQLPNFPLYSDAGFVARDLIGRSKAADALQLIEELNAEIPPVTNSQKACMSQNFARCYEALQMPAQAEKYYLTSLAFYKKLNYDFEESREAELAIGRFYLKKGDFEKAGGYLREVLPLIPTTSALATIKDVHLMLYQIDSAQGNYLEAMRHLREHNALKDSIFNETTGKQIQELNIRYESKEKENQINGLNHAAQLQTERLAKAAQLRNIIIAGSFLLVVIIALLYNQYRIKQKANNSISQKNRALRQLVNEKEWLIKEIHHRVKNNLQTVVSLLEAQSIYLKEDALQAIQSSQHRVHAMALIHQKLYQTEEMQSIHMRQFLPELINYLKESFGVEQRILFDVQIDDIELDVALGVPVALIINEAVTNAMKYAFLDDENATIRVWMQRLNKQQIRLTIADNGIGLPDELRDGKEGSLGLKLIAGLTGDINGECLINNINGTTISITFTDYLPTEDHSKKIID